MQFTINSSKADKLIKRSIINENGIYKFVFCTTEDFYIPSNRDFPLDTGIRIYSDDPDSICFESVYKDIHDFYEPCYVYHKFYYSTDIGYLKILIAIKNCSPDTLHITKDLVLGRIVSCDGHFDYVWRRNNEI